jgi:TRAP-type uncharacterized transport system fused permease subunit
MFVFYFAVASAITPPVAIAAFAAASISKTEPMRTGFAAVRVGIVMFTIPFVFAWYPELLLIEEAITVLDDNGQRVLIEGYGPEIDFIALSALLLRLSLALYLMASALARFDKSPIGKTEMWVRLFLVILVLWKTAILMWIGIILAITVLLFHRIMKPRY